MARATTQAGSTKPGSTRPAGPALDIDALLADPSKRIIVCCGSGGVGKTTTAAALGLRAAESDDLALAYGERDSAQRGLVAIAHMQPVNFQHAPSPGRDSCAAMA